MVQELPENVTEFLSTLATNCEEPTINSYKHTFRLLVTFLQQLSDEPVEITTEDVAEYMVFEATDFAGATRAGMIHTISNFIAYTRGGEPDIINRHIKHAIKARRRELILDSGVRSTELSDFGSNPTGKTQHKKRILIESLVEYLRHCNYGSRVHAMVEVVLTTGCRVRTLQQLDLEDIDIQQGTALLRTSEKNAIPPQVYDASLSDACIEAIETYVDHERSNDRSDDTTALFTTQHGRVSTTTIRRSFSQAVDEALDYEETRHGDECPDNLEEQLISLSPNDLRWYAVSQLRE